MEFISSLQARHFHTAAPAGVQAFRMSWNTRAREALRRQGWSVAELARRADLDLEALYKQLKTVAQPRGDVMQKIAAALGVSLTWLRDGEGMSVTEIPVVGYASAGDAFTPFDDHAKGAGFDTVPVDFGSYPIAVEVRGQSMMPVYRPGDRLMCDRLEGDAMNRAIGRDAIAMTASGEGYLKRVIKGSRRGLFTLRSYNPDYPDIADQRLIWVAPVAWIRRGQ